MVSFLSLFELKLFICSLLSFHFNETLNWIMFNTKKEKKVEQLGKSEKPLTSSVKHNSQFER